MATAGRFEHPLMGQAMVYHRMQGELERDYFGQWVIIHDSKLVGGYGSYDDAEEAAQQMGLDVLACFIRQVGSEPIIILSYGRSGRYRSRSKNTGRIYGLHHCEKAAVGATRTF